MAKIKPFKGVRPPQQMVTEVASRPYDVLNSEEARQEAEGKVSNGTAYKCLPAYCITCQSVSG